MASYFKYRTYGAALDCLRDESLYFAKPAQLNDMLEVRFDMADARQTAAELSLILREVAKKHGVDAKANDFSVVAEQLLINAVKDEDERFISFTKDIGIFSAAKRPDDQAMWAYYADNSQGVCFELDWADSVLYDEQLKQADVFYIDAPRIISRAGILKLCVTELSENNPNLSYDELCRLMLEENFRRCWGISSVVFSASIKHTDWKHEQEVRLIAPKYGAKKILKSGLKAVHFVKGVGNKLPEKLCEILLLLRQGYPDVEVIQWEFSHGNLKSKATNMEFKCIKLA
jgi:hypothetical protein